MFNSALAQLKNRKRKKDWSYFRFDNALLINYLIEILQLIDKEIKSAALFLCLIYNLIYLQMFMLFFRGLQLGPYINVTEIAGLSNRLFLITDFFSATCRDSLYHFYFGKVTALLLMMDSEILLSSSATTKATLTYIS